MFSPQDIARFGWADRGAMGVSYNSVVAADFDSAVELLWVVDKFASVVALTPGSAEAAAEPHVHWNVYSTFRALRDPQATPCTGAVAGLGHLFLTAGDRIKMHRWGGMCALNIHLPNLSRDGHPRGADGSGGGASGSTSQGSSPLSLQQQQPPQGAAPAAASGGGNPGAPGSNNKPGGPPQPLRFRYGINTLQILADKGTAVFGSDASPNLNLLHIDTAVDESSVVQIACTSSSPITSLRVIAPDGIGSGANALSSVSGSSSIVLTGTAAGEVALRDPRDLEHIARPVISFQVAASGAGAAGGASTSSAFAPRGGYGGGVGGAAGADASGKISCLDLRGYTLVACSVERRYNSVVKFFDIRKAGGSSSGNGGGSAGLMGALPLNGIVNWSRLYSTDIGAAGTSANPNRCVLSSAMDVHVVDVAKIGSGGGHSSSLMSAASLSTSSADMVPQHSGSTAVGVAEGLSMPATPSTPAVPGSQFASPASSSSSPTDANPVLATMRLLTTDGSPVSNAQNRQMCSATALSGSGRALIFASDRGVMQTFTLEDERLTRMAAAQQQPPHVTMLQVQSLSAPSSPLAAAAAAAAESQQQQDADNAASSAGGISSGAPGSPLASDGKPKYPPQPQPISKWREFGMDSGFVPPKRANGGNGNGSLTPPQNSNAPEHLVSDWPPDHYVFLAVDPPATQLPAHIADHAGTKLLNSEAAGVRRCDAYASNPKDKLGRVLPNPYPFNTELGTDKSAMLAVLTEKRAKQKKAARAAAPRSFYSKMEEALQLVYSAGQPGGASQGSSAQATFDWSHYNMSKTIVGLDNSLPESYVFDAVLHALYHVQGDDPHGIRKALMNHVCAKPACVACELGFLFCNMATQGAHYMGVAPITQPTNLFRTLRQIPAFRAFFSERPSNRDESIARTHRFVKLLLQAVDDDLRKSAADYPLRGGRFRCTPGGGATPAAPDGLNNFMAATFGTELALQSGQPLPPHFLWELPASASEVIEGLQHLLRELERMHVGEPVVIQTLPTVLVLLLNPDHGTMRPPPNLNFARQHENYAYHHCGSIVHLARDHDDPGHSVNHIKVGHGPQHEHWYLINDYAVSKAVQREDALESMIPRHLPHAPTVAFYVRQPQQPLAPGKRFGHHTHERPNIFDAAGRTLVEDFGVAQLGRNPAAPCEPPQQQGSPANKQQQQHQDPASSDDSSDHAAAAKVETLLDEYEVQPGDLVAIDAEYVRLAWGNELRNADGEIMTADELPDDWTRRMLQQQRKPMMSLARVSCILSQRDGHERVIIDDYIETTSETIEDYVTLYSGIAPGDLDPKVSRRRLTTAKAAHLKLRALLDRGVRFVGHGLAQDFRVINLAVPPGQIVDTVEIYARPGQRKISLRFLAFHALKERVQESMHDSIEDARTALRLYRLYEQLLRDGGGRWESELERLFEVGADTHWRVDNAGAAGGAAGGAGGGSPGGKGGGAGGDGDSQGETPPSSTPMQSDLIRTPAGGSGGGTVAGLGGSGGEADPLLRSSPMKQQRTGTGSSATMGRVASRDLRMGRGGDDTGDDSSFDDEEEEDNFSLFDEEEEEGFADDDDDDDSGDENDGTPLIDTRTPSPMARGGTKPPGALDSDQQFAGSAAGLSNNSNEDDE